MTQAIRNEFVKKCKKYMGVNESNGGHKAIIDLYNENRPAGSYKMTLSDPWCATYVSAMAVEAGLKDTVPLSCSCQEMIRGFERAGRYEEDDNFLPTNSNIGDILFYDWEGSVVTDSIGNKTADHVGVIISVSGTTLTIIEGNKNDRVETRTIEAGSKYICGFGLLEAQKNKKTVAPAAPALPTKLPTLRSGDKGEAVKALQALLNHFSNADLKVDGGFGSLTADAVRKWQKANKDASGKALVVDGIVGVNTWASLTKA